MRIRISAWALLAFALLCYFGRGEMLCAVIPAACVHELGHALTLVICGAKIKELSFGFLGFRMDYIGELDSAGRFAAAISGPAAGIVWFAAAGLLGGRFKLSSWVSLLLSLFNLLPIPPLDGGMALSALVGGKITRQCSMVGSAALTIGGLAAFIRFGSPYLFAAGAWLLTCSIAGRA